MAFEVRDGKTTYTFEAAASTRVHEGHLFVYNPANEVIATFAPGQWTNSSKVGTAEIKKPGVAVG